MKKIAVLCSLMCLVAAFVVATGQGEGGAAGEDTVYEIEYLGSAPKAMPPQEENMLIQAINERLGIKYIHTGFANGEDVERQLNIRIAAGNPPDLFHRSTLTALTEFVKDGTVMEVTQYADKMPNWKTLVNDDELIEISKIDGKLYSFCKPSAVSYEGIYVRKDWIDKMGLDMPETMDDVVEIAHKFTYEDPDGNGKQDTFGISGRGMGTWWFLFGAYEQVRGSIGVKIVDGKPLFDVEDPRFKEAVMKIRELIEAGVVDPEIMTHKVPDFYNKVYEGKVGFIQGRWPRLRKPQFAQAITDVNPDAEWVILEQPIQGPYARKYIGFAKGSGSFLMMPIQLEKNQGKVDKMIEFIEFISAPEGNNIVSYGLEGVHYDVVEGKIVAREAMFTDLTWSWAMQLTGRNELEYLGVKFDYARHDIETCVSYPVIDAFDKIISGFPDTFNKADADRFMEEEILKFIYGSRDMSEWDTFISELDSKFGHKEYRDYIKAQMKEMGIVD